MTPSFSGLTYLFNFLVLAFLTYYFWQSWQKEKNYPAQSFFYFGALFTLFCLITAIGGIFFPSSLIFLKGVVVSVTFIQGLACAFLGALIVYLKFPQFSPKYGFLFVFLLGLTGTILTGALPSNPHLMANNWISWDVNPLAGIFRLAFLVITFLPLGIILIQQSLSSQEPTVKIRSLGIGFIFLLPLLFMPLFFLFGKFSIEGDFGTGLVTVLILLLIFFTQKPPSKQESTV